MKHFPLNYQNAYDHQTFQGGDMLQECGLVVKWNWGHVTVWKIYVSTLTRFIANKLGRLLTLERIFRTQTLKSSATSCCTSIAFFVAILNLICYLSGGINKVYAYLMWRKLNSKVLHVA